MHQLAEYMIEQGVKEGYLLTFNFNKSKKYTAEWIKEEEKKIFDLYDKATNTVYHFEYARKAMGNLPAIKK